MLHAIPLYVKYLGAIVLSAVISAYSVKKIIFIARNHKIYDVPDDTRKIHGAEIPTLGGIGIFIGYVIVAAFFWPTNHFFMPYMLASSAVLFFTGIYDDLMNMRPSKKLVAQLIASFITIYLADIRFTSLFGFFSINDIPYWPGILFTTLLCTFFINVFNFVDGIDGLAGTLSVLYLGLLGLALAAIGHENAAGICLALAGATIGLLVYNIAPAKIYMGDTGSMFLGFSIFIFSLLFVNWCVAPELNNISRYVHNPQSALLLVIAMLFLPIVDALRVFALRASRGVSPLKADRTHLHYYLLDAGFGHTQSVAIIAGLVILHMVTAFALQDTAPYVILLSITAISFIALAIIYRLRKNKFSSLGH